jgi:transposase
MLCRLHLDHLDHLDGMPKKLDAQIEAMMQPFHGPRELLITIPGIGPLSVAAVISEIGTDVAGFFADAAHLASWAGLCPGNHESAGKRYSGRRRHGNKHLQPVLVECAWAAVRHAHAILVIIWHVLATGKPYHELGADYFTRRLDPEREAQRLIARLQALGKRVTLEDAA